MISKASTDVGTLLVRYSKGAGCHSIALMQHTTTLANFFLAEDECSNL